MRQNVSSGSPFEPAVGFSRAVRVGNLIAVSGTVGRRQDGSFSEDLYEQTRQTIENIAAALAEAGATLSHVVRTRIYLLDIDRWEEVARAHLEAFGAIRPASSMVEVNRLATSEMLVELEADAIMEASQAVLS